MSNENKRGIEIGVKVKSRSLKPVPITAIFIKPPLFIEINSHLKRL